MSARYPLRRYELAAVTDLEIPLLEWTAESGDAYIKDIQSRFVGNILRVLMTAKFILQLAAYAALGNPKQFEDMTMFQEMDESLHLYGGGFVVNKGYSDHFAQQVAEAKAPFIESSTLTESQRINIGNNILNSLVNHLMRRPRAIDCPTIGIDPILASIVVESWGAYESLCKDLWITVVNRDKSIARKIAKIHGSREVLSASSGWGELFYKNRSVGFGRFSKVLRAYDSAFGEDIKDSFEPLNTLKEAEQLRNLFAHSAGIVDKEFMDQLSLFTEIKDLKLGQRLIINGPRAKILVDSISLSAESLLRFVDKLFK